MKKCTSARKTSSENDTFLEIFYMPRDTQSIRQHILDNTIPPQWKIFRLNKMLYIGKSIGFGCALLFILYLITLFLPSYPLHAILKTTATSYDALFLYGCLLLLIIWFSVEITRSVYLLITYRKHAILFTDNALVIAHGRHVDEYAYTGITDITLTSGPYVNKFIPTIPSIAFSCTGQKRPGTINKKGGYTFAIPEISRLLAEKTGKKIKIDFE